MGQSLKYTEPTIWALRKGGVVENSAPENEATLYEHLFGYDPIRINPPVNRLEGEIRKGSAENPQLNILNPRTNFIVMEIASDEDGQQID